MLQPTHAFNLLLINLPAIFAIYRLLRFNFDCSSQFIFRKKDVYEGRATLFHDTTTVAYCVTYTLSPMT